MHLSDFRLIEMAMSNVFYHYTSHECLKSILDSGTILPSRPHPATPGWVGGVNLNATEDGIVFLTRVDPKTPRNSIAFNNFRCCCDLELNVWLSSNPQISAEVGQVTWVRSRLTSPWRWILALCSSRSLWRTTCRTGALWSGEVESFISQTKTLSKSSGMGQLNMTQLTVTRRKNLRLSLLKRTKTSVQKIR